MAEKAKKQDARRIMDAVKQMNAVADAVSRMRVPGGSSIATSAALYRDIGALVSGLGKLAGPIKAVTTAIGLAAAAAKVAAKELSDFARLRGQLRGNNFQTAFAQGLGDLLGTDALALGKSIRAAAANGGLGSATAARYGIPIMPHDIGNNPANLGAMLVKTLERAMETDKKIGRGQAISDLTNLGAESLIPLLDGGKEIVQIMREDAKLRAEMFTPARIQAAMRLNLELARLKRGLLDLVVAIGNHFLPIVTATTRALSAVTRQVQGKQGRDNFAQALINTGHPTSVLIGTAMKAYFAWKDKEEASRKRQTEATEALTDELRQLRGIYGGGERARSAIPKAFQGAGYELDRALRANTSRFGAYSVAL